MRKITSLAVGLMVLAVGGIASAEEVGAAVAASPGGGSPGFGDKGQIAIGSDFMISYIMSSSKPPQGDTKKSTTIRFAPALDYFVADKISVGGQLVYQSVKPDGGDAFTTTGLGVRAGYALGLGEKLSLWPRGGIQYLMGSAGDLKSKTMTLQVFVPVQYHPAKHFFVGIGPVFEMDLSSKVEAGGQSADGNKTTNMGLTSTVGGYF